MMLMAYRNTLQAGTLKLVAEKRQSSFAVEGELPEDGLAAHGDDDPESGTGQALMLALARKIVSGEEDETEIVEEVFVQARDAEAASEEFLVVQSVFVCDAGSDRSQGLSHSGRSINGGRAGDRDVGYFVFRVSGWPMAACIPLKLDDLKTADTTVTVTGSSASGVT